MKSTESEPWLPIEAKLEIERKRKSFKDKDKGWMDGNVSKWGFL